MEYHPEWEDDYKPPMPKAKRPKDPKIEDEAVLKIMQLAIHGAIFKCENELKIGLQIEDVLKLFKEVGFIK